MSGTTIIRPAAGSAGTKVVNSVSVGLSQAQVDARVTAVGNGIYASRGKTRVSEFGPDLGFSLTKDTNNYQPLLLKNDGTVYAKPNNAFGLAKSTDGMNTWTVQTTAPDGGNTGAVSAWFTPAGNILVVTSTNKLARTTDEGATWSIVWTPAAGLETHETILENAVAIYGGAMYAAIYDGYAPEAGYVPRVIKSTDDGVTWTTFYNFPDGAIRHIHGLLGGSTGVWALCGDAGTASGIFYSDGSSGFVKKSPDLGAGLLAQHYVALSAQERNGKLYWAEDTSSQRPGGIYSAPIANLADSTKLVTVAAVPTSGWYSATDAAGNILIGGALEDGGTVDDSTLRLWAIDPNDRVHEVFSAVENPADTLPKNILRNLQTNSAGQVLFCVENCDFHDLSSYQVRTGFLGSIKPGPGLHPRRQSQASWDAAAVLPVVCTADPVLFTTAGAATANVTYYARVMGRVPKRISKIGLVVGTSSGNISVGVFSGFGMGQSTKPSLRKATSGAVACPAAGYAEVPLTSPVTVNEGDWLALSVDNATATFLRLAAWTSAINKGRTASQAATFPDPSSAVTGSANGLVFLLIGVA